MTKPLTTVFVILFLTYFSMGFFVNDYSLQVTGPQINQPHPLPYYDYSGVINVHTDQSTGTGTFEEVVLSAQKSKLDFIALTDFNQFPQNLSNQGYYNKLLVLIGGEYSYINSNLLNIGASSQLHLKGPGQSQPIFKDLLSKKDPFRKEGLFILAHPLKRKFQWKGDYPEGLDGLEIINLKSVWKNAWETKTFSFLWNLLMYPFNPELSFVKLLSYPESQIKIWDTLSERGPILGFAGTDAESRFNFINDPLKFPSYQTLFKIVRNHVLLRSELTGQQETDAKKILNALRGGNFYFSIDFIGAPKGFLIVLTSPDKQFLPGSKLSLSSELRMQIRLPQNIKTEFQISLYRNGVKFSDFKKENVSIEITEPGVYRTVVWVKLKYPFSQNSQWVPWIFVNPFYIGV